MVSGLTQNSGTPYSPSLIHDMCSLNKSSGLCSYTVLYRGRGFGDFAMSSGIKKEQHIRAPGHTTWSPYTIPGAAPLKTSPISLPPNNSWSTKWHWANKAPFQKRLQLQQETLWLWVCLKCYQYHDHSCGSTKPSLITIPWLHLRLCINPHEKKKGGEKKKRITVENRGVICLTRSTCNDKAVPFSALITHLHTD